MHGINSVVIIVIYIFVVINNYINSPLKAFIQIREMERANNFKYNLWN